MYTTEFFEKIETELLHRLVIKYHLLNPVVYAKEVRGVLNIMVMCNYWTYTIDYDGKSIETELIFDKVRLWEEDIYKYTFILEKSAEALRLLAGINWELFIKELK